MKKENEVKTDFSLSVNEKGAILIGCISIEDYSEKNIRIGIKKGCVAFDGEKMTLKSYYPDVIEISGIIKNVSFGGKEI